MNFNILKNGKNDSESGDYERYPSIVMSPQGGNHYTVNITQNFGDAYTFDNVIALLANATEFDDVTFNINSKGGNLFSLIALQNAISVTQARFHMVLLGEACSAGGALFLTEGAATYQVGKHSMLMIHPVQCGTGYGAATEGQVRADVNSKINDMFVRSCYKDFLTEEEIDDVINNNREIYLFDDEINDRLSSRIEIREKQLNDHISEIERAMDKDVLDELSDEELKADRDALTAELKRRSRAATKKS